ncbi:MULTISPECIES: sugar phosphate nucleotidyltransferase [Paenibacillus]|uniref:sugar phosphate nucleotidyltransferase n=1 Tax=Paenibacillus TaxID=44249 RepID=UPI0022B8FEE4|nr:sugar phosphate nucleotidyltransferase [Paenibacillus caseinilyticus]MCZ8523114.1 sugar phosphate nucleotidyltransferase [Paenibacillus caseinilyticus]
MKLILLSGGSGQRLWPLSNDIRSKQFIKLLRSSDGKMESMVQRVWGQLEKTDLHHQAYIATGKSQVGILQNQLGMEIPLIIEPSRMDTFPAVALAAAYLFSEKKVDLDEVVIVLPVDPYVEDGFYKKLFELEKYLIEEKTDIALLGVKPSFPSEKYGYIVPTNSNADNPWLYVSAFKEKPSEATAKELIDSGALWNCGIFAFKLGYLLSILNKMDVIPEFNKMTGIYNDLPKISFDYEVVEKAKNIIVVPYDGQWKDLGTWNTITEEMGERVIGRGTLEHSPNTHIVNELDIPTVVLGIENAVVISSPDGILVADKSLSPKIKGYIPQDIDRVMYEERHWGMSKTLEYRKVDGQEEILTKRILIRKDKNISVHYHKCRREIWTILHGECEILLGNEKLILSSGDTLKIMPNIIHSIRALTDLEFIEIQCGSELTEEDVYRISLEWL